MAENCCGVKILDLDGKYKATGQEYLVVAEKDNNFKMPMELIADTVVQLIIDNDTFKATVTEVYESPTPVAKVNLVDNEFLFSFGIPAGKQGDPGRDGKDGRDGIDGKDGSSGLPGIDGDTTRLVMAYKSTSENVKPATPTGGSWDYATNVVTYPEGWSGSDTNNLGYLWMSNATFSSNGTIVVPWSDPVCFSGKDGRDGVDGTSIEFVYKLTVTHLTKPTKPSGNTQASAMAEGWTDHPTGISEDRQCEWVSQHTLQDNKQWSSWSEPTIWSRWGTNGKDGDGVEYIYQRTKTGIPPTNITDNNPDLDEYIPNSAPGEESWMDNPQGVTMEFQYEWVSKRKYDGSTGKWGNFSSPALWAKWSDAGQDGMGLRIMYTITDNSSILPHDPDRRNIDPGSSWGVGMPKAVGKQAIWAILALVTYDNQLYLDPNLPEDEQGWQGPYLITGVPGLDGNNFNYQVEVFKESSTQPDAPISEDPYHPGNGWVLTPDMSTGIWWKCVALVQGETGTVIEWGAVVRVTGLGITIKGTLSNYELLPNEGNLIGDAYVINGELWVWNGTEWVNVGKVQGTSGNYYEYRFARNNSWQDPPELDRNLRYPTGWSNTAPALSSGKVLWATFALISGADNSKMLLSWCEPYYMTGMTGDNGGSGIPGVGFEVRYAKGTIDKPEPNAAEWNDVMKKTRYPQGWSLDCPTLTKEDEYNYIWIIQARVLNDLLEGEWSKPYLSCGIIVPDPVGKQPMAYPMGVYNPNIPYINDGIKAPYVYDNSNGKYYFLKLVMTWLGTNQNGVSPATDTSGAWTELEGYEAIYTDLLIAPNSLVGGAVFNNNLMFSQRGKDLNGSDSSKYQNIDINNPMNPNKSGVASSEVFIPNFLLDFSKGDAYFCGGGLELTGNAANAKVALSSSSTNSKAELTPGKLTVAKIGSSDNFDFTVDYRGIDFSSGSSGTIKPLVINADGSGKLANGHLTWNKDGDIEKMSITGMEEGEIVFQAGNFTGMTVTGPLTGSSASGFNKGLAAIGFQRNFLLGDSKREGYIKLYNSLSDTEWTEISSLAFLMVTRVSNNEYRVTILPAEGITFSKNGVVTKKYTIS